jgi:hypothetical protein
MVTVYAPERKKLNTRGLGDKVGQIELESLENELKNGKEGFDRDALGEDENSEKNENLVDKIEVVPKLRTRMRPRLEYVWSIYPYEILSLSVYILLLSITE